MSIQDKITEFEVLFALRTGVTILLPRIAALDEIESEKPRCWAAAECENSLYVGTDARHVLVEGINKDAFEEACERGIVMFYELEDDEVVRCTSCPIV